MPREDLRVVAAGEQAIAALMIDSEEQQVFVLFVRHLDVCRRRRDDDVAIARSAPLVGGEDVALVGPQRPTERHTVLLSVTRWLAQGKDRWRIERRIPREEV